MKSLNYRQSYKRRLPHIQPEGANFFVTFRLKGSIPHAMIQKWKEEQVTLSRQLENSIADRKQLGRSLYQEQKRYFGKFDIYLDQGSHGPTWLKNRAIAQMIVDALHYRDGKIFRLDAYCIMPNHVHLLINPLPQSDGSYQALAKIMHSLKRFTASQANKILDRSGQTFWQAESYDHIVRNAPEWKNIMSYILDNPVKAGLVTDWQDWPWSYCKYIDGTPS